MASVCRADGCGGVGVDEPDSRWPRRAPHELDRRHATELADQARPRYWRQLAALTDERASALAGHVVGTTRIGRPRIWWAIADFLSELGEAAAREMGRSPLVAAPAPRLRVLSGGGI
jgi:hypothetical protein